MVRASSSCSTPRHRGGSSLRATAGLKISVLPPQFPGDVLARGRGCGTCQVEVGDSRLWPHGGYGFGLHAGGAVVDAVDLPPGAGDVMLVGEGRPPRDVLDLQGTRAGAMAKGVWCPRTWGTGWDEAPCSPWVVFVAKFGHCVVPEGSSQPPCTTCSQEAAEQAGATQDPAGTQERKRRTREPFISSPCPQCWGRV